MQPRTTYVRPRYQHRPHRGSTAVPRGREGGVAEDPLAPARGIMNGVLLGAALWAGIIAVLIRFFG